MTAKQKPAKKTIDKSDQKPVAQAEKPKELGGRGGPDPVRYGDWEMNGKCVDF